jgi:flagellar basal-body rod protein FlgF/flagellar basal-body rod protein FlgG
VAASTPFGTGVALRAADAGGQSCDFPAAMPYGMYLSGEGAAIQAQRLEVIANNLANVDTVGFKPDVPTFQARFAEAIQQGLAAPGDESINDLGGGVKLIDVETDFSTGSLKETGGPLDLAITGNGFFHVLGDDGQQYLTRAGNFTLDAEGRVVTQNGHRPVLDQAGGEISLDPDQPFAVTPDGFISQAGNLVALGMSQPASLDELAKVGHNMFRPLGSVATVPLAERHVRQGYLEMSGANPVRQMMSMIETTRAFEANTRMIQNQDTMLGTLISRVLTA